MPDVPAPITPKPLATMTIRLFPGNAVNVEGPIDNQGLVEAMLMGAHTACIMRAIQQRQGGGGIEVGTPAQAEAAARAAKVREGAMATGPRVEVA